MFSSHSVLLEHEATEQPEEANLTLGKVHQRLQTLGTLPHLLRSVLGAQRPLLGFLLAPGQLFDLLIDLLSDPCGLLSGFLHASLGFGLGVYRLLAARFKLSVQRVDALSIRPCWTLTVGTSMVSDIKFLGCCCSSWNEKGFLVL